jgi:poly-gamma-glutamate capsule biosynthesis protein CapA/YwtB (metallophosphatase superfamily)
VTPAPRHSSAALRARREARRRAIRRRRLAALAVVVGLPAAAVGFALAQDDRSARPAERRSRGSPDANAWRPSAALARARVAIVATGDIAVNDPAGTAPPLFANVRATLRGDVVIGNLEGALTTGGESKCERRRSTNCFAFRAPPDYARVLGRAGFTVLTLANNHSGDFGAQGRAETVAALRAARLGGAGYGERPPVKRVGGVRVAVLGFAPGHAGWDLRSPLDVTKRVLDAAARADVVVVTMHAGAEGPGSEHVRRGDEVFLGESRGDVVAFAHAAVEAGADLVVGHGPHVLRGMEWYRRRLIAYSLGNFAGYQSLATAGPARVSGILRVTLRGDGRWVRGRLVPVRLVEPGIPVLDEAEEAHGIVRRLSREDFHRRGARITRDGRILRPAKSAR